jgi:hypothetical protein
VLLARVRDLCYDSIQNHLNVKKKKRKKKKKEKKKEEKKGKKK